MYKKEKRKTKSKKVSEDKRELMRTRARTVVKIASNGQSHRRQKKLADAENRLKNSFKKEKKMMKKKS